MLTTKKGLVKKLWKSAGRDESDVELYDALKTMVKSVDSKELKGFTMANEEGIRGACWMLPSVLTAVDGQQVAPEKVICKIFRWKDLDLSHESLRRLPTCPWSSPDSGRTCCNPFHFGRVLSFNVTPLEVDSGAARSAAGRRETGASDSVSCDSAFCEDTVSSSASPCGHRRYHQQQASSVSCGGSYSTGYSSSESGMTEGMTRLDVDDSPVNPAHRPHTGEKWLDMAYWDGKERVGQRQSYKQSSVHVLYDGQPAVDQSFSVAELKKRRRLDEVTQRKRQQIGDGFVMWRSDDDKVYMYNASDHCMFIQSPTLACSLLDDTELVKRVPAGSVVELFDWERAVRLEQVLRSRKQLRFPFDCLAARVSMISGWGADHRRPTIMQCPCWMELFF